MKKGNWITGGVVTITLLNAVFPGVNASAEVFLEKIMSNEIEATKKKNAIELKVNPI